MRLSIYLKDSKKINEDALYTLLLTFTSVFADRLIYTLMRTFLNWLTEEKIKLHLRQDGKL